MYINYNKINRVRTYVLAHTKVLPLKWSSLVKQAGNQFKIIIPRSKEKKEVTRCDAMLPITNQRTLRKLLRDLSQVLLHTTCN